MAAGRPVRPNAGPLGIPEGNKKFGVNQSLSEGVSLLIDCEEDRTLWGGAHGDAAEGRALAPATRQSGPDEDRPCVRGFFDHVSDDASHIVSCTVAERLINESLGTPIRVAR
jgi:hypothetical protein